VEKQTQNKIEDLLPAGSLGPQVRLVLTNAIYFKGMWAAPFEAKKTEDGEFTKLSGEKVLVPMMHQQEQFRYAEADAVRILELPYAGDGLVMDIILPKKKTDLLQVEQSLTAKQVQKWLGRLVKREVLVTLPRFRMTVDFQMSDTLRVMGMPLAFSGDADFSGITDREKLFISEVYHKAFVEVNEEGTEAAAATGLVMRATAVPVQPAEFRADHPFYFMIRDTKTGAILFMGRVTDPS
jgi:serpin B